MLILPFYTISIIFSGLFFVSQAFGQKIFAEDRMGLSYQNYADGIQTTTMSGGPRPFILDEQKTTFILSLSISETRMNLKNGLIDDYFYFRSYGLTPIFLKTINDIWKVSFVMPFRLSSARDVNPLTSDAISTVGGVRFNQTLNERNSSLGFGVVLIRFAEKNRIFPDISLKYQTVDGNWFFSFGFPRIQLKRSLGETLGVGVFLGADFSTFLIDPTANYSNGQAKYLTSQIFHSGLELTYQWNRFLFSTFTVGKILNERLFVAESNDSQKIELDRDGKNDMFGYLKLSLRF